MLSFTVPATTPAEATAYLALDGRPGWPVEPTAQAQAIMRGQRALAALYNSRWLTEWSNAAAPGAVKHAIAEAALVEAVTPGTLSSVDPGKVLTTAGKLGWEVTNTRAQTVAGKMPDVIEGLLADLIERTGACVPLLRW